MPQQLAKVVRLDAGDEMSATASKGRTGMWMGGHAQKDDGGREVHPKRVAERGLDLAVCVVGEAVAGDDECDDLNDPCGLLQRGLISSGLIDTSRSLGRTQVTTRARSAQRKAMTSQNRELHRSENRLVRKTMKARPQAEGKREGQRCRMEGQSAAENAQIGTRTRTLVRVVKMRS
jgi:hypothetical protein